VGTQGGLGTEVFLASHVTTMAPGGHTHEYQKQLALAELGGVRRDRSKAIADDADRMEASRRAAMVTKVVQKGEEAVKTAVGVVVVKVPELIDKWLHDLVPKQGKAAKKKSDEVAKLLEAQCRHADKRTQPRMRRAFRRAATNLATFSAPSPPLPPPLFIILGHRPHLPSPCLLFSGHSICFPPPPPSWLPPCRPLSSALCASRDADGYGQDGL
jgi:hypothetical protein